jgi:putative transposase
MPTINSQKIYRSKGTYHIYNRGAFKMPIFKEQKDYEFFYLLLYQEKNRYGIQINVEALLPNHFHLQIFQKNRRDIQKFMKSVGIRYSFYFRKKYSHSGRIFQGCYKASLLMGLKKIRENTFYILDNPKAAHLRQWNYCGKFTDWRENFL